jgi:hypothetical protein
MNRRGFLGSILALGAAPAIVRADSLMRVVPVDTLVFNSAEMVIDITPTVDFTVAPPNLSEIISATLRNRSAQFAENVRRGNQLLLKVNQQHEWVLTK